MILEFFGQPYYLTKEYEMVVVFAVYQSIPLCEGDDAKGSARPLRLRVKDGAQNILKRASKLEVRLAERLHCHVQLWGIE